MTLKEYMNDPAIIHEPQAMREIHAIRLKHHDDRREMSSTEYTAIVHKRAQDFLAEPIVIKSDLTAEERAITVAGEKDYREHPETFVPLESIL
jgi:hypothetical protein